MANINIRIDGETKKKAEQVFSKLGMTPTTAITLFYNQVIRTKSIPFELHADIPNEETIETIKEIDDMEKHPEKGKTYSNIDGLVDDLLK